MIGAAERPSSPTRSSARTALLLAAAVAAALIVRGTLLWLRGNYLDYDEGMYLLLARSIGQGEGLTLNGLPHLALGPFVPAATAAIAGLFGLSLLVAQRLLSALAGALLLIPVWHLLRRTAGSRIAWIAVSLLAVWPTLVDVAPKSGPMWFHMYVGTEPTYLFFLFASVAIAEAAIARRGVPALVLAALAGTLLAIAYLTRAEAVLFFGMYVVVRGVQLARRGGGDRRNVVALALVAAGFLIVAAPHLAYLRRASGSWIISGQPDVMRPTAETLQDTFRDDRYLTNYVRTWYRLDAGHSYLLNPYWGTPDEVSRATQVEQFAVLAALETPTARALPARMANRLWNYAYMLWTLCGALFVPLVVVGIVTARRREQSAFVVAGLAASLATGFYLAVLPRFFLYLVPAFALWAAYGIDTLAGRVAEHRVAVTRFSVIALVALSLAIVGRRAGGDVARYLTLSADADREAAEALAAALPEVGPVMHWQPGLAYWAGWEWRTMPVASLNTVAHYGVNRGIKHVLLTTIGYLQVRGNLTHMLVILDEGLEEKLRSLEIGDYGRHTDPATRLETAPPVAGYATRLLKWDDGETDGQR